jgi:hypothetical protein
MSKELYPEFTERDMEIMCEISREANGNDDVAFVKGVQNQIEYSRLVSNL